MIDVMGTNSLTTDTTSSGQAKAFGLKASRRYALKASGAAMLVMGALFLTGARAPDGEFIEEAGLAVSPFESAPVPPAAAPVYTSRLEQIAAEQGDAPIAAPVAAVAIVDSAPEAAPAAPAHRTRESATVQLANAAMPSRNGKVQPAVLRTWTAPLSGVGLPAASPNVFGSTALTVGRTPMDAKWRSVSHSQASPSVAGEILAKVRGESAGQQLERVNTWVNRHITFTDDIRSGQPDYWSNADDSLRRGAGDCEDYAIAKLQILRAAGFDERDLYLVLVRDLVRRADHAILVARLDGRLVVLDSNTDRIVSAEAAQDYKPLMSFSGDRSWIHGYRQEPQVQYASNAGLVQPGEGPSN
jgi:predicted transglutaminase-like cysteine proteinase